MSRPTMEDVAAHAGVSRALVSIVYRDAPGASDATRARVLAAGAELGYRPDHRARLLGRQRTRLLGVTFDVQAPFHGDLIEALYTAADSAGYDLALSAVAPTRDEPRAIQSLLDYRCEALILLGPRLRPSALAELANHQPTVVVARKVRAPGVDVVRTDDTAGSRLATEHLISLGHHDIAHIDGGKAPGSPERRTGYRQTMRRAGLSALVIPGGLTETDGTKAADTLLTEASQCTGVTVVNDSAAIGLLHALRQAGHRVPEDFSIIGYDNSSPSQLPHISLTTVAQNIGELADHAVGRAIARAEGEPATAEATIVPLVVRRATAGLNPKERSHP